MLRVLAILPARNEESSVAQTIMEIKAAIPNVEILVVDNASTDNTESEALRAGAKVTYEPNLGKGFGVRNAFSRVTDEFDVIFMTDADDTYSIDSFQYAANLVHNKGYDMVIGNRVIEAVQVSHRNLAFRTGHKIGNLTLSKIFTILFNVKISDSLSGWRVMSPGFVGSFTGGKSGFEIESELNAHAFLISAAISNVDVVYRGRITGSHSKLNTYKDGAKILRRQLALFRLERPRLAYSLMAIPWILMSTFLMRNVLTWYFRTQTIPNFPSLIGAVGCFICGALLWVAGIILENVRYTRVQIARYQFSELTKRKQKKF